MPAQNVTIRRRRRPAAAEEVFRFYLAALNRSDGDAIAWLYGRDAIFIDPSSPKPVRTRAGVRESVGSMLAAFTELTAIADDVADGDRLAARLTICARHTGDLRAPGATIEASGEVVELRTADFLRSGTSGLITEHVRIFDGAPPWLALASPATG